MNLADLETALARYSVETFKIQTLRGRFILYASAPADGIAVAATGHDSIEGAVEALFLLIQRQLATQGRL